ncbi:CPBP family intramembrane glutamic endopeptidase [Acetobacter sp.]|uniref:CPBP family intramembrane glutamic endopeptidase n=1 Tax=Acetobacter sp. TaxID=440 RepID=UPI0039E96787
MPSFSFSPVSTTRSVRLGVEFVLIFFGGPLLILAAHKAGLLFGMLWGAALLIWLISGQQEPVRHDGRREVATIFRRFAVLAPIIALLTWVLSPQTFFQLPRERPVFWLVIMVLYPLLSVWPQEMLYRRFLFARYAPLFRSQPALVLASAVSFGFAHVMFLNWIAVSMTLIGGFLFARDYARHRSVFLACVEHSLYGCLVFTLGLGRFFYTGAAWHGHG